jgi:hypothetical protein
MNDGAAPHKYPGCLHPARAHRHRGRLTTLIAAAAVAALFRWNVNNPRLIAATAVVGLIAFPLLQPTWVMVK